MDSYQSKCSSGQNLIGILTHRYTEGGIVWIAQMWSESDENTCTIWYNEGKHISIVTTSNYSCGQSRITIPVPSSIMTEKTSRSLPIKLQLCSNSDKNSCPI